VIEEAAERGAEKTRKEAASRERLVMRSTLIGYDRLGSATCLIEA